MTSTFFQRSLLIILLIGIFPALKAQEYKYEIGGLAGASMYMGDANKNSFFKGINPAFGGVFRYNVNFRWAIKANLMWGKVSGSTSGLENEFPGLGETSFSRNFFELGGQGEFNFLPYSDKFGYLNTSRFSPYILLGIGVTVAPGNGETMATLNIPLGVGVKYKIMNRVNLGLEYSFRKLFADNLEGNEALDNPYQIESSLLKNKDWYSCLLFTVTWDFGPRDRDCNNIKNVIGY